MLTFCLGIISIPDIPSTEQAVPGCHEVWIDGTNYGGVSLQAHVVTPGPSGARLVAQVWDGSAWVDALSDNAPYLPIDTAGQPLAQGLGLSSEARDGWHRWRFLSVGGDDSTDVTIDTIRLAFQ